MISTAIAVAGTLLGSLITATLHHHTTRSTHRADYARIHHQERLTAVVDLATALADHRLAMWAWRNARLTGDTEEQIAQFRQAKHRTRSAITGPLTRVRLLHRDQEVQEAANRAVEASYAIRYAQDHDRLATARQEALEAHDTLLSITADRFSV